MENDNVVKVLHDCCQAAAALFYQKSISIRQVFDSQVGDLASLNEDLMPDLLQSIHAADIDEARPPLMLWVLQQSRAALLQFSEVTR